MAEEKTYMQMLQEKMPVVFDLDADTVRDSAGDIRYNNLNAPEVDHMEKHSFVPGDWGGEFYTKLYASLANEAGYTETFRTGDKGYYGRDLGGRQDEYGEAFSDKLYYEGLARPKDASTQELSDMGVFARAFRADVEGEKDDMWQQARDKQTTYMNKTMNGFKELAVDEAEKAEYDNYFGKSYSPLYQHDVQYRNEDRDLDNIANSNFRTGWAVGWGSIRQSATEAVAMLGDILNDKDMYDWGMVRSKEADYENSERPVFSNDLMDVTDAKSFGNWVAGIAGVALPYMLGLIGTRFVGGVVAATSPVLGPGAFGAGMTMAFAPAVWVYAGEAYGNMEGGMDQKNAGLALSAGIVMAALDFLGLRGIMGASTALKKDGIRMIAKEYAKKEGIPEDAATKIITDKMGNLKALALKDIAAMSDLQMNKSLLATAVGKRTLKGMAVEGATEFGQESTGYLAGHFGTASSIRPEFDMDEWQRIAINATAGGFLLGGGIAGTTTTYGEIAGFNRLKRDVSPVTKNKNWFSGTALERADDMLQSKDQEKVSVILDENGQPIVKEEGDPDAPEVYNFEGAGRDVEKEFDDDYKTGHQQDLSTGRGGDKTLWQNVKEFPERFTRKVGAFWENRAIKAIDKHAKNPERAKELLGIILSQFGMSNTAWMQSLDLGDTKRLLQQKLLFEVSEFKAELNTLLGVGVGGKTDTEATKIFMDYLQAKREGKPTNPEYNQIADQLDAMVVKLGGQIEGSTTGVTDNILTEINKLLGDTAEVQRKPFYFQDSAKLKLSEVVKDKDGFVAKLMESGWTKIEAEEFYEFLEGGPLHYDKGSLRELGFVNFPARSVQQSKDELYKIFGKESKFLENDPFQRLRENIQEQVNYAVDKRILGDRGIRYKKLMLLLKDEMGEGWDPRMLTHFTDSIAASRGDYRRMKSRRAERMIGHITFFNTFSHLDLSAIASLPEAALVLLGATRDKKIMELFQMGVNDFARKYVTEGKHGYSYINPSVGMTREQYTRNLADFYRYGYGTSTHGAIGQVGIDEGVYKASKIKEFAMSTFFRANLLKIYTDTTRVARLSMANDAIFGDLEIVAMFPPGHDNRNTGLFHDAFERLRDLKIDPDRVATRYKPLVDAARMTLNEGHDTQTLYDRVLELDPTFIDDMDIARMTWVDNAIAHPDAMNRPLFYSNPYYRLFTQYNGFMSVFTASILPKIWKRVKSQDPTAKYSTVAIGAAMIVAGFLSQAMKDEWRYGGRPGWLNEKGFIQRGVASSGLLGTPERLLSMLSPIYDDSRKPWESTLDYGLRKTGHALDEAAGPTWAHGEQLAKIFMAHISDDPDRRNMYLSKEIPFLGKNKAWKDYNLGRGDINIDEAIKRSIPFF
jgi:hypothetical protein